MGKSTSQVLSARNQRFINSYSLLLIYGFEPLSHTINIHNHYSILYTCTHEIMIKSMHINTSNQKEEENTLTSENLIVAGRVAVTVAVVLFLAVGLQGRVARVLEKATVPVSDDGLAWIGSEHHSLLAVESGRVLNLDLRPGDGGARPAGGTCC